MRCEELERIVLEGGDVTQQMREHAQGCEACRVLLENADVLSGSAQLDDDMQVPETFAASWRAAVREEAKKGRVPGLMERVMSRLSSLAAPKAMRALGAAACAVVLFGLGTQMGGRQTQMQQSPMLMTARSMGSGVSSYAAMDTLTEEGYALSVDYDAAEDGQANGVQADEERKIVRTAQLDIDVEDMDAALAALHSRVTEAGGSIAGSEVWGEKGSGRWATYEVRVPAQALDTFLSGAGSLGHVTREATQQTDMTGQYMDNASRLASANAQKQRLDELFAQAQDMDDIVALTDAIFEVQQEIDSLTGANAWIDSRAAQSTVTLSLREKAKTPAYVEPTFFEELAGSFTGGLKAIGSFFAGAAYAAAWALPWGVLLAGAYAVVRAVRRRRK